MISTQGKLYFSVVAEKHNGVCVCGGEITVRVTQLMNLQGCWCHLLRAFYSCSDSEGVSARPVFPVQAVQRARWTNTIALPTLGRAGSCTSAWECLPILSIEGTVRAGIVTGSSEVCFLLCVLLLNDCTQALKLQLLSDCVLRKPRV